MRVVYLDTLFFLNLSVDYFLLLLTARVAGRYPRRRRLLLGAAVGAVLAVLLYFPPLPLLPALALRLAVCWATVAAAFYRRREGRWLRLCGVFVLLTCLLAGAVLVISQLWARPLMQNGVPYFEVSGGAMLASFAGVYLLLGLTLGQGRGNLARRSHEVEARMGPRTLRFRALEDSGNLLRDPLSGKSVLVVQAATAAGLFADTAADLLYRWDGSGLEGLLPELRRLSGVAFWLLPARTAGGGCLMLAFRPEELYIDGTLREDYLLGLTGQRLDIGGDCRALMGV